MTFKMPEEELWVRQVYVGDYSEVNRFLTANALNPLVRSVQILCATDQNSIVVVYELNIKAPKKE